MRLGRRLSAGIAEDPPAVPSGTRPAETPAEVPVPATADVRSAETREPAPAHLAER